MAVLGNCLRCDCQLAILCPGTVGGVEYDQVVACGSCGYPYIDHEQTIPKQKAKPKKGKARIPVPQVGKPDTPVHFPGFMPQGVMAVTAPGAGVAGDAGGGEGGEPANPGKRGRGRPRKADAVDFPGQHPGD